MSPRRAPTTQAPDRPALPRPHQRTSIRVAAPPLHDTRTRPRRAAAYAPDVPPRRTLHHTHTRPCRLAATHAPIPAAPPSPPHAIRPRRLRSCRRAALHHIRIRPCAPAAAPSTAPGPVHGALPPPHHTRTRSCRPTAAPPHAHPIVSRAAASTALHTRPCRPATTTLQHTRPHPRRATVPTTPSDRAAALHHMRIRSCPRAAASTAHGPVRAALPPPPTTRAPVHAALPLPSVMRVRSWRRGVVSAVCAGRWVLATGFRGVMATGWACVLGRRG